MTERWRPIPGYDDLYQISDQGQVWSIKHGRTIKQTRIKERITKHLRIVGYLLVSLSDHNGQQHKFRVHRLVLLAFVGPCPPGLECCHANDIPTDNRLENLRWDTTTANRQDRLKRVGV